MKICSTKIRKSDIEYVKKLLIMFFWIFEMPIISVFTTRRIIWLIALYMIIKKQNTLSRLIKRNNIYAIIFFSVGMFCCMLQLLVTRIGVNKIAGNNYFEVYLIIIIFCNIILFSLYCLMEYKDVYALYNVYIPIMIFQSIVVYISAVNTKFRLFIYKHFYYGDSRFETAIITGERIMGINLHSATGSLILATACIILIYLAINKKIETYRFILQYAFITGATMFIGRTGFYLEIILLMIYFLFTPGFLKKTVYLLSVAGLSLLAMYFILKNIDGEMSTYLFHWITAIFREKERARNLNIYTSMQKISLTSEMIFGTGIMRGWTPKGVHIDSDSGYVMLLGSIGIIGSVIYYSSFLVLYCMSLPSKKNTKQYLLFIIFIGIAFFIELKEPFSTKSVYYTILYLLQILCVKENCEIKNSKLLRGYTRV